MIFRRQRKAIAQLEAAWGKPKTDYFNYDLITAYFNALTANKPPTPYQLTDGSVEDLEFDMLFQYADRTASAVGQQYLYAQMRNLYRPSAYFKKLECKVAAYTNQPERRTALQLALSKLNTPNDYYFPQLIFTPLPAKVSWYKWVRVLQITMVICIFGIIADKIMAFPFLLLFFIQMVIHYWYKKRIGGFGQYFGRIGKLYKTSKACLDKAELTTEEKEEGQQCTATLRSMLSKTSYLQAVQVQEGDFSGVLMLFTELFKILTLAEITVFHTLIDEIDEKRVHLERLFSFIGEVDLALSVASFRSGLPYYTLPTFTSAQKCLHVEGLYHPLIADCVPNQLTLNRKSLLLTGSNMSGKTTFVRSLNLNLVLAQTLYTATACAYEAPMLAIATSIRVKDSLSAQKSYYMAEVDAVHELIKKATQQEVQYLFSLDEVFKGTNTIERISAGRAILHYLNSYSHLVLVATHDLELTELLQGAFDLYYFQESVDGLALRFDYQLKEGVLEKQNALRILELAGYPEAITSNAHEIAEQLLTDYFCWKSQENAPPAARR